jgi:predicted metal-binding membrane protein
MALLFVGGIMNLVWIGGLALFVLAEKLGPNGRAVSVGLGGLCLAGSLYILAVTVGFL